MIQSRNSTQGKDEPSDQAEGCGVARTSSSRELGPCPHQLGGRAEPPEGLSAGGGAPEPTLRLLKEQKPGREVGRRGLTTEKQQAMDQLPAEKPAAPSKGFPLKTSVLRTHPSQSKSHPRKSRVNRMA